MPFMSLLDDATTVSQLTRSTTIFSIVSLIARLVITTLALCLVSHMLIEQYVLDTSAGNHSLKLSQMSN
jgi:hypothetical protein